MKLTNSGTTAELMQKVEQATGEVVAIHHDMECRSAHIEHVFNVFIGNEICKRCDSYLDVVRYLKSFIS